MRVFRVHKTDNYSVMSNHHLKNKDLSLQAKGMLSLMLSLPEEWDYSISGLTALSKNGKDSVISVLGELCEFGYVVMTSRRDEKGRFITDYDVYEEPKADLPMRKNRIGKTESENPQQLNTIELNTIINTSTTPARTRTQEEEFETIKGWLTENDERLNMLLYRNKMIQEPQPHEMLLQMVEPFICEFANNLFVQGKSATQQGRTETISHFAYWLPQYLKQKSNEQRTKPERKVINEHDRDFIRAGFNLDL